jgi:hypothetical protein
MKGLAIIACAMVLGGCAPVPWSHAVKGDLEFEHDAAFCEAVGGAAARGMMADKYWLMFGEVARALTERHTFEQCLQRRGWTPGSASPDVEATIWGSTKIPAQGDTASAPP